MTVTAAKVIEEGLRLLTIIDLEEHPTPSQIALGVEHLKDVLLTTFMDGMQGFQMFEFDLSLPAGQSDFFMGVAAPNYDVQVNTRMVQSIFLGYTASTKFELRREPWNKLLRVSTSSSLPVRFATQDLVDGGVRVKVWPTPTSVVKLHILGYRRVNFPTAADGSDILDIPPDAEMAIKYAFALRSRPIYGVPLQEIADVVSAAKPLIDAWKTTGRLNTSIQLMRSR